MPLWAKKHTLHTDIKQVQVPSLCLCEELPLGSWQLQGPRNCTREIKHHLMYCVKRAGQASDRHYHLPRSSRDQGRLHTPGRASR